MTDKRAVAGIIFFGSIAKLAGLGVVALSFMGVKGAAEPIAAPHPTGSPIIPGRIVFRPKQNVSEQTLQGTFVRFRGKEEGRIPQINVRILRVPDQIQTQVLEALRNNPNIEFAEPDYIVQPSATPNDPYFSQAWHLPIIGAPTAWDSTVGSSAVTIAILDSGIDATHPDLAGLLVPGWNFYDNNSNLADVSGHGTAVAGVAAALSNNGQGVAGVTWNCRIMPLRITDLTGYGSSSAISSALTWAADHGARVANISYGNVTKITAIISAAQYFQSKGGVVTAAAGNSATFDSTADNPYFLLVSATDSTDTLCSWSNTGNNVDLAAPGQNVVTTVNGGGYGYASGTSFSAPVVAGVAALVLSVNPSLSGTKVQDILKQNADDLGTKGWDTTYGWGRVNAARAVAAAGGQTPPADTTAPAVGVTSPTAGATLSATVSVTVSGSDNVGVTKVEWYLDGALKGSSPTTSATFGWDTTTAANSAHSILAKAYDAAGNVGSSASVSVIVNNPVPDTTAPVASVSAPANGSTVASTVSVNVSGSDNVGVTKVEWYLDVALKASNAGASANFSWNSTSTANGTHTLCAKAYDAAGNTGTSANISVIVNNPVPDTTAPVPTVSSPADGAVLTDTTSVTVSASDNVGVTKIEWYLDGTLQGSNSGAVGSFNWDTTGTSNGSHTITSKAYDAAGNIGSSGSVTVAVNNPVPDTTAPTVAINSLVPAGVLSGTVSISVSASDNVGVAKVEWYLDGTLSGSSASPSPNFGWDTTTTANGSHTVSARAYDAAGNAGNSAPMSVSVNNSIADIAAPVASVSAPSNGATVSGAVSVTFSGSDDVAVAGLELYVDNALVASVATGSGAFSWDTTVVPNGSHNLFAKAYDTAGNIGTSTTVTITVNNIPPDTTAPTVQITSPASGNKVSRNVKIAVSAADNVPVTSIDLYIDGKLYQSVAGATATFSWNTAKVAAGSHALQAFAYDAAGNKGSSAIVTVTK